MPGGNLRQKGGEPIKETFGVKPIHDEWASCHVPLGCQHWQHAMPCANLRQ